MRDLALTELNLLETNNEMNEKKIKQKNLILQQQETFSLQITISI